MNWELENREVRKGKKEKVVKWTTRYLVINKYVFTPKTERRSCCVDLFLAMQSNESSNNRNIYIIINSSNEENRSREEWWDDDKLLLQRDCITFHYISLDQVWDRATSAHIAQSRGVLVMIQFEPNIKCEVENCCWKGWNINNNTSDHV